MSGHRRWIALANALAVATILGFPAPVGADFHTWVATRAVPAFGHGGIGLSCAGAIAIGGGFDTLDGDGLALLSLEFQDDGGSGQFYGDMRDDGGGAGSFKLATLCDDDQPEIDFVELSFSAASGTTSGASVVCPIGTRAINGGAKVLGTGSDVSVAMLSPGFLFDGLGTRLFERPDGTGPPPFTWWAHVLNTNAVIANGAAASATCVPFEWRPLSTEVKSGSAVAGVVTSRTILCDPGSTAVGGGVDAGDPSGLELVGSGPVFGGPLLPTRLADLSDGPHGAPIGWRVALRNGAASARPFKAAAVCAPEPGDALLGAASLLTLGCAVQLGPMKRAH